ncbi:hypothetical protein [Lactobacillus equicursoris]|uniref:hypothetical protein n=1 Tax=Lactobacillus equicursoris TaxID=420645 RepID=UPI0018A6B54A|nr:hypothetical protein [Lactobacillus equicursoris]
MTKKKEEESSLHLVEITPENVKQLDKKDKQQFKAALVGQNQLLTNTVIQEVGELSRILGD